MERGQPGADDRARPALHGRAARARRGARRGRPALLRRLARRPRPAAHRRPALDGVGDASPRRPGAASRCAACSGARTGTGSASTPRIAPARRSRSTRPAGSACATCGCAPAARTTRSSSCCGTATTRRATSPSSAASTCATAAATTSPTRATRRSADAAGVRPAPGVARRAAGDRGAGGLRRRDHLPRAVGGPTPLTLNPGRLLSSLRAARGPLTPRPLPSSRRRPRRRPRPHRGGAGAAHLPAILPKGYDFAPQGERSVAHANTKAVAPRPAAGLPRGPVPVVGGGRPALRHGPAREPRAAPHRGHPDGPRRGRRAHAAAAALRAQARDGPADRGGRRPGRGLRAHQRGGVPDLRALQGLRHRRRVGQRRLRQLQPALLVERLRGGLRRAGHAGVGARHGAGAARLVRAAGAPRAGGRAPRHPPRRRARRPGCRVGPDGGRRHRARPVVRRWARPSWAAAPAAPQGPAQGHRGALAASLGRVVRAQRASNGRRAGCGGCRRPS